MKLYRYFLNNDQYGEGHNLIILDQDGEECHFFALGDYGKFVARFYTKKDIREFVLGAGEEFFLRYIARQDKYDGPATLRAVKERILELRYDRAFTREEAREEWNRLSEFNDLYSEDEFNYWCHSTNIEDAWEYAVYDYAPGPKAFVRKTLPRLKELLRAELVQTA